MEENTSSKHYVNEGSVTGVVVVSTHGNSLNPMQLVVVLSLFYSE